MLDISAHCLRLDDENTILGCSYFSGQSRFSCEGVRVCTFIISDAGD